MAARQHGSTAAPTNPVPVHPVHHVTPSLPEPAAARVIALYVQRASGPSARAHARRPQRLYLQFGRQADCRQSLTPVTAHTGAFTSPPPCVPLVGGTNAGCLPGCVGCAAVRAVHTAACYASNWRTVSRGTPFPFRLRRPLALGALELLRPEPRRNRKTAACCTSNTRIMFFPANVSRDAFSLSSQG